MIDDDEKAYYEEIDQKAPFEDIRGDEAMSILLGISSIICIAVAHLLEAKSKMMCILSVAIIIAVSLISAIPLEKLYYKIKYKRYPHLNPNTQKSEEDDNNK